MAVAMGSAQREVLGAALSEIAADDPRILVLDGDVASSTGAEAFDGRHPHRFVQTGIAEQNTFGVAAGLATVGFIPVVSMFACFAVGRAFDSIRVLIDQPALDVKIAAGYTGLLTGMTGKTHQMLDDVAIMRTLPNMRVLAPADDIELREALRVMVATPGPFYVQVAREPTPRLFPDDHRFALGQAVSLRSGTDVTLVSTGVQTARVVEAAEILDRDGIAAAVLHMPSIKPLDEAALVEAARATGFVVVVEEQSVLGGLGGAVAEVLSDRCPVPVKRLGIQDVYGESGPNQALLDKYRLSAGPLAEDIRRLLSTGHASQPPRIRGVSANRPPAGRRV